MRSDKTQLHYYRPTGEVSDETYHRLVAECERLAIDPVRDLLVTDGGASGDPALRYHCWVRKNGWGMRLGRHEATIQAAAESLLAKLRKVPA